MILDPNYNPLHSILLTIGKTDYSAVQGSWPSRMPDDARIGMNSEAVREIARHLAERGVRLSSGEISNSYETDWSLQIQVVAQSSGGRREAWERKIDSTFPENSPIEARFQYRNETSSWMIRTTFGEAERSARIQAVIDYIAGNYETLITPVADR